MDDRHVLVPLGLLGRPRRHGLPPLHAKGLGAEAITDVGGIVVNLVLLALAPLAGAWWRPPGSRFSVRFLLTLFLALAMAMARVYFT